MSAETAAFIYCDAQGFITARSIRDVSESDVYLQGFDQAGLRTFRKDRILERLAADAVPSYVEERLAAHREANPAPEPKVAKPRGAIEVCFTGFKAADKATLIAVAEATGFIVRPAVTAKLHFLCCGDNAGPAKVRKARAQGVVALTDDEFRRLADTGEVPDGAPVP